MDRKIKNDYVITFTEEGLPRARELLGLDPDTNTSSAFITKLDDEEATYIKLALPGCQIRRWPV